ncbi:MAG: recombinase family protein [Candidatus Eisenbacteria bacterium]|uniref:Recombinase family protein n=1 Tax=Eiseniibacteriota bacterium TaxID=2212470 RepID=A0A937X8K6_UNCEI|nr:recombinase family protein [Candidatus Eisenbacteria bacterium]
MVSPKAKGWAMPPIRVIIMNPVCVGRLVWNRRRMGKSHRIADRREVERDGCGRRRLKWNDPTTWTSKWRKDGTRIGTAYYVCGAA